jgi:hypothetical protein
MVPTSDGSLIAQRRRFFQLCDLESSTGGHDSSYQPQLSLCHIVGAFLSFLENDMLKSPEEHFSWPNDVGFDFGGLLELRILLERSLARRIASEPSSCDFGELPARLNAQPVPL